MTELLSPPPVVAAKQLPDKVVVFASTNGVWSAKVKVNNPKEFFTKKDFNSLRRLLETKLMELKRQATLEYRRHHQGGVDNLKEQK